MKQEEKEGKKETEKLFQKHAAKMDNNLKISIEEALKGLYACAQKFYSKLSVKKRKMN